MGVFICLKHSITITLLDANFTHQVLLKGSFLLTDDKNWENAVSTRHLSYTGTYLTIAAA